METQYMQSRTLNTLYQARPGRANRWAAQILLVLLLLQAGSSSLLADLAANTLKHPKILPGDALQDGNSLQDWLGTYWRWAQSGGDPAQSRIGSVSLLPLPAGDYIEGDGTPASPALFRGNLELELPADTTFVLPLYAWISERYQGYPEVPDDLPFPDDGALSSGHPVLTIDGKTVISEANKAEYYVPRTVFDPIVQYPAPLPSGSVAALSFQGIGVISQPLKPGKHTIHLYVPLVIEPGVYSPLPDGLGVIYDNTWTIKVKP